VPTDEEFAPTPHLVRGDRRRREVLGDAHVAGSNAALSPLRQAWRDHSTEVTWGQVWDRPNLDVRSRCIATLSVLAALGLVDEVRIHINGALRQGMSPEELLEVFIQVGAYAGVPRAAAAIGCLDEIAVEPGQF
jgi:alkylhydroperoxidase/carboxymuconolactone decarboxylase family protein YurZ